MRDPLDRRAPLHDLHGLRSLLAWSYVGLVGAAAMVSGVVLMLVGAFVWDPDRRVFHRLAVAWGVAVTKILGARVEVRGASNAEGGPFIIAPNHQSVIDLIVLYLLPLQFRTVVKRSWFYGPFGFNIWAAGYIPTSNSLDGRRTEGFFERCRQTLDRGLSILIFPEGTRSRAWQLGRFKRGAFELAVQNQVAVLPVAVAGTNDISHPASFRFGFGRSRIILEILPPIPSAERDSHELRRVCKEVIAARVDGLRRELREEFDQGPVEVAS